MEPWNLAVYTDTNRAHICCHVCSLLGPIPFILFLGQNSEGWFHKIYWLYEYWLYLSSVIIIWFLQVWYATESGNLEVTYTHNEDHVCIILFTFPLDTLDFIIIWCLKCWCLVWNQFLVLLSMIQPPLLLNWTQILTRCTWFRKYWKCAQVSNDENCRVASFSFNWIVTWSEMGIYML